jgi:hypothetical protein
MLGSPKALVMTPSEQTMGVGVEGGDKEVVLDVPLAIVQVLVVLAIALVLHPRDLGINVENAIESKSTLALILPK